MSEAGDHRESLLFTEKVIYSLYYNSCGCNVRLYADDNVIFVQMSNSLRIISDHYLSRDKQCSSANSYD